MELIQHFSVTASYETSASRTTRPQEMNGHKSSDIKLSFIYVEAAFKQATTDSEAFFLSSFRDTVSKNMFLSLPSAINNFCYFGFDS